MASVVSVVEADAEAPEAIVVIVESIDAGMQIKRVDLARVALTQALSGVGLEEVAGLRRLLLRKEEAAIWVPGLIFRLRLRLLGIGPVVEMMLTLGLMTGVKVVRGELLTHPLRLAVWSMHPNVSGGKELLLARDWATCQCVS